MGSTWLRERASRPPPPCSSRSAARSYRTAFSGSQMACPQARTPSTCSGAPSEIPRPRAADSSRSINARRSLCRRRPVCLSYDPRLESSGYRALPIAKGPKSLPTSGRPGKGYSLGILGRDIGFVLEMCPSRPVGVTQIPHLRRNRGWPEECTSHSACKAVSRRCRQYRSPSHHRLAPAS
jgi:hypothetical protein